MAKINKMILGKISGSLGDVTFRQRNGKNYLASRPGSFTPGSDQDSIDRRAKFALSVRLASIINSIPQLKEVWNSRTPNGSTPYNYMVKTNYKLISPSTITDNTLLTPGFGFGVQTSAISLTSSNLQAGVEPIGTNAGIDTSIEKNLQLFSIIAMSDPKEETVDNLLIVPVFSELKFLVLDAAVNFTIPLSNQVSQLYGKYDTHKVLLALITLDETNSVVHYSNTFVNK
jgi:hypothetical protein